MATTKPPIPDMAAIGATGAQEEAEREDVLRQLRGERWYRIIREMTDTDPIVRAVMFTTEMMIRRVKWTIMPASKDPEDLAVAQFVDEAMFRDMDPDWEDTLSEILSFLPYGWSLLEVVYKRRNGEADSHAGSSHFNDGRIGWKSWSIRPQETLSEWVFTDDGDVEAMVQIAPPHYRAVTIPIDKALLFRTTSRHGSPEGASILRSAYQPWYYKREIQKFEAIGIERDLAGVPVAGVPASIMAADAKPNEKAVFEAVKQIVTNLRRNQQEGVVMPIAYDNNGNKLYELELLTSGGQRQINTDAVIQRYDARIAMSVLADFVMVGHESVGTYSMTESKMDLFMVALQSWVDSIASTINEQAIHRLLRYNGIPVERSPRLTPGSIRPENLKEVGEYLNAMSRAGALKVTPELQHYLMQIAGLPVPAKEGE